MKIKALSIFVLASALLVVPAQGYAGCPLHEESYSEAASAPAASVTAEEAELHELAEV